MKEYVIASSQIFSGYRRVSQIRSKLVYKKAFDGHAAGDIVYGNWIYDTSINKVSSNNQIKYNLKTGEYIKSVTENYENRVEYRYQDSYRFDVLFDTSEIPSTANIQSVKLRSKISDVNGVTPRGYYVATLNNIGTSDSNHLTPVSNLANRALTDLSSTPFVHEATLSGLSSNGWYCIYNVDPYNSDYDYGEILTFDMSSFQLIVTTDEQSVDTYTVTYDKGDYGTGATVTDTKTAGVDLSLQGILFTRTDYTQTGWSVNADGSTKDYNLNAVYSTDANITLYPYWTSGDVPTSGGALYIMTENGLKRLF